MLQLGCGQPFYAHAWTFWFFVVFSKPEKATLNRVLSSSCPSAPANATVSVLGFAYRMMVRVQGLALHLYMLWLFAMQALQHLKRPPLMVWYRKIKALFLLNRFAHVFDNRQLNFLDVSNDRFRSKVLITQKYLFAYHPFYVDSAVLAAYWCSVEGR